MKKTLNIIAITSFVLLASYTLIGTSGNIEYIKQEAPKHMAERGWRILRYEGYQYGSWMKHGGKCWYHVCNIDNPNIQYRVQVSSWNGELQYWYGAPEQLDRFDVKVNQ